jgi:Domain of unknown function (DUF4188)
MVMAKVIAERMTAEIEGDFVVFLIGIRINKIWKLHKWMPTFFAMGGMLKELRQHPECGFLGALSGGLLTVQYWRSFEHLEAYAKSRDRLHLPAWAAFNKRMVKSRGDVGIWHETYLVHAGQYETLYSGMPRFGLGSIGNIFPASGSKESARDRFGNQASS